MNISFTGFKLCNKLSEEARKLKLSKYNTAIKTWTIENLMEILSALAQ